MPSYHQWPKKLCAECGTEEKYPDTCLVCGSSFCEKCWRRHAQYQEVGVSLIHEIFTCPVCGARREFWYYHKHDQALHSQTQPRL